MRGIMKKKIVTFILTAAAVTSLIGCGINDVSDMQDSASSAASIASEAAQKAKELIPDSVHMGSDPICTNLRRKLQLPFLPLLSFKVTYNTRDCAVYICCAT